MATAAQGWLKTSPSFSQTEMQVLTAVADPSEQTSGESQQVRPGTFAQILVQQTLLSPASHPFKPPLVWAMALVDTAGHSDTTPPQVPTRISTFLSQGWCGLS